MIGIIRVRHKMRISYHRRDYRTARRAGFERTLNLKNNLYLQTFLFCFKIYVIAMEIRKIIYGIYEYGLG